MVFCKCTILKECDGECECTKNDSSLQILNDMCCDYKSQWQWIGIVTLFLLKFNIPLTNHFQLKCVKCKIIVASIDHQQLLPKFNTFHTYFCYFIFFLHYYYPKLCYAVVNWIAYSKSICKVKSRQIIFHVILLQNM